MKEKGTVEPITIETRTVEPIKNIETRTVEPNNERNVVDGKAGW